MFHTVPKVSQVRNPTSKQTENVRRDFARVRLISVMILLTYITDVILVSLCLTDRLSALLSIHSFALLSPFVAVFVSHSISVITFPVLFFLLFSRLSHKTGVACGSRLSLASSRWH